MENEILADVKKEGEGDPFAGLNKETDTPSDSPTDNNEGEVKPDRGDNTDPVKDVPFHEHPRWKEREAELKELRQFQEEARERLQKLDELESRVKPVDGEKIPQWFKNMYGDDPETWNDYVNARKEEKELWKRELLEEQEAERTRAEQETAYWTSWVDEQVNNLADAGVGFDPKRDSVELKNIMLKYRPTDEEDNLDFKAGWEILQIARAKQEVATTKRTDEKKKVATLTTDRSRGETQRKDFVTNHDLQSKGW